jgi:methanogenic corrinoid protein MtbC1
VIPFEDALHRILLPLQERVGQLWHDGRLGVATEHYVTKHVQQKIFAAMNQLSINEYGPKIVVACPSDEQHDIAAQASAYLCSARGCRVSYLGANVPVAALAAFCRLAEPKLIALSLTTVPTPNKAADFVKDLRAQLTNHALIVVGGIAAQAHALLFEQAHITVLDSVFDLETPLRPLVTSSSSAQ